MAQPASLTDQTLLATDPQALALSRQQQMADLLTQNSMQQPTGNLISGRYVAPSWAQQLQPLFNAAAGAYLSHNAENKQQALAQALRDKKLQEQKNIMEALNKGDTKGALGLATQAEYGGKEFVPSLIAANIPKAPEQLSEKDKAELKLRERELGLRSAELGKGQVVETPQGAVLINPFTGKATPLSINGQPILGKGNLTESQGKAAVFHSQMVGANNELNNVYAKGFNPNSPASQAATGMAGGMLNFLTPSSAQQAKQAQNQWTEAYLRFKTGAGTNAHEIEANRKTYFPDIGDSPEVVAQKARMRQQAQNDIAIAAGVQGANLGVQPQMQQTPMQQAPVQNQQAPSMWGKAIVVGQ